ncbi:lethal(3)malignant brain tumor-like protein 4 [Clytia hemisphaerica]|uniref:SAM domain-containing protein n=1 Tax=Clytia hemisphaerica TaxID=252671 RepID=A0A7M5X459_9CNID
MSDKTEWAADTTMEDSQPKSEYVDNDQVKEDMEMTQNSTEESKINGATGRKKRKTKSKYSNLEDDDLEKMLKWKNGIGLLPGSNLKFRKSLTGELEVITPLSDDENGEGTVDDLSQEVEKFTTRRNRRGTTSRQGTPSGDTPCSTPPPLAGSDTVKSDSANTPTEKRNRKDRKKKKFAEDELLKCETCGCYGLISEFRSSGRFCSQRCVGAYASKRRTQLIQQQLESGERPPTKQTNKKSGVKKKKTESKDGTPSSPSLNKNKKQIKQEIKDDSILYFQTVGHHTGFCWETYLQITATKSVPVEAFFKEYDEQEILPQSTTNQFEQGMKLECIDPKHQSIICCCTVVEVQGARLRLNFDGWPANYDFWINSNSFFLHPCGWCSKNQQKLQPPKDIDPKDFEWSTYLMKTQSKAAPANLFFDTPPVSRHAFRISMKLEAIDRKNPDLVCVASVANTIGDQILIHFDEWDDLYDYWCREDNPYIHPMGWCQKNQIALVPPTDEMVGKFVWKDYLNDSDCIAAPDEVFKEPKKLLFVIGDKMEVIDPRNPTLCRVATVNRAEDFKVQIHFDGWPSMYDWWFDFDSMDLHPVGWCQKTGHVLEPPPSGQDATPPCGIQGCRGVGHIKGAKYTTHHTSFGCPYTSQNIHRTTSPVVDRLVMDSEEVFAGSTPSNKSNENSPTSTVFPDSTTNYKNMVKSKKAKDKSNKGMNRKRKRRGSDEVSSSTNFLHEERITKHEYSPMDIPKKIRSTHIPAGLYGRNTYFERKSQAIPWNTQEVGEFLSRIGYAEYVPIFKDNQIDGQALLLLSQADLVHHLNLKLGPALKIYSEISKL